MNDVGKNEMVKRLRAIVNGALDISYYLTYNDVSKLEKPMQEIEQHSKLVRIDVDYLKAKVDPETIHKDCPLDDLPEINKH